MDRDEEGASKRRPTYRVARVGEGSTAADLGADSSLTNAPGASRLRVDAVRVDLVLSRVVLGGGKSRYGQDDEGTRKHGSELVEAAKGNKCLRICQSTACDGNRRAEWQKGSSPELQGESAPTRNTRGSWKARENTRLTYCN